MKIEIRKQLEEKLRKRLLLLSEFVVDYIFSLEYQKKELRTRIEYAKDIYNFLEFLVEQKKIDVDKVENITPALLDNLTSRDIWDYLSYITSYEKKFLTASGKIKVQTFTNTEMGKARKIASLQGFFEYLLEHEIIHKNILSKISIKVDNKAVIKNRLTPEDMQRFYAVILDDLNIDTDREKVFHQKVKFRDYIIVLLLSYTGIRVSELVQLDIDDVSIKEECIVVIRKGGKQEKIPLPSIILEDIKDYLEERKKMNYATKALFVSMHKKRINPKTINMMLKKYQKRANIDIKVTPHVFRRTFGTNHYNKYRDMYLTAQILGHRSAETTRKFYADPSEERIIKSMKEFDYSSTTPSSQEVSISMEKLRELSEKLGVNLEELIKK